MLHCPNPECPFRKRYGRPADYRAGFATCSDCGRALVDGPGEPVEAAPRHGAATHSVPSDADRRLAFTVLVIIAVAIAMRLPMIGITLFDAPDSRGALDATGLFTIGLDPFVAAFQLIEIVALLPFLAARRVGSRAQRRPLTTVAMVLGLVFLVMRASSVNQWAQGLSDGAYPMGQAAPWLLFALVLPSLALVGAAWLVDRRGLGNGFMVVLLAVTLSQTATVILGLWRSVDQGELPMGGMLGCLILYGALCVILVRRAQWPKGSVGDGPRWAPVPLMGALPITFASTLMSLPVALGAWSPTFDSLALALRESYVSYLALMVFLSVDFALVLGFLGMRPAALRAQWARWSPAVPGDRVEELARRALPYTLGASALFVAAPLLVVYWIYVTHRVRFHATSALLLAIAFTALADLLDEWKVRRRLGSLVAVVALYRVTEVEPVLLALKQAGIEAHAKSARYRSAMGFFGPYAPIEILVPAAREADAKAVLEPEKAPAKVAVPEAA